MADVIHGQVIEQREDVQHTSYTHTDAKQAVPSIPPTFLSTGFNSEQFLGEGFTADISRVSNAVGEIKIEENERSSEELRKDSEAKTRELEAVQVAYEKEVERRMEAYRKQQEQDADRIRKELEKLHQMDVEFRKQLVELAFENQRRQIDLEARYGKRDLERERQKAKMTLEKSKFHTDINVNMDAKAGSQDGQGCTTVTQSNEQVNQ